MISVIDPLGQAAEYAYDNARRRTEIRSFNPDDHVNPIKTVTFTYDKLGNLMSYDNGEISLFYE